MKKLLGLFLILTIISCETDEVSNGVEYVSFRYETYTDGNTSYPSGKMTFKHIFTLNNKTGKVFNGKISYQYKISTLPNVIRLTTKDIVNLPKGLSEYVIYDTTLNSSSSVFIVESVNIK